MAIDIGTEAINRDGVTPSGYTFIVVDNPANASGTIISVSLYADASLSNVSVGIFYNIGGLNFKCRSTVAIGAVGTGLTEHEVSLAVETGDYIGIFYSGGALDRNDSGGGGAWYEQSNNCVVDNETLYALSSGRILSLSGTDEAAGANILVTPTTIALSDAQFVPILKETTTPTTLSLSDTQFAPILKEKLTPSTLVLSGTEYIPVITIGILVYIALSLYSRSLSLTLQERSTSLTLNSRSLSFTLLGR